MKSLWIGFFTFFMALILLSSMAFAACETCGQGQGSTTTTQQQSGQGTQTQEETQNQGTDTSLQIRERVWARNASELRNMIQERTREMNEDLQNMGENQQNVYRNQNRIRVAVHALISMENLTGGIGGNISQIARQFNNSVQATIRLEERIQNRNMLVRFFLGGDQEACDEMEGEVNRNRERIQELTQLMNQCNCSSEVKAMLQEQIQNMEEEQNRLQQFVNNEKNDKGIFGWIFAWFRR